MGLIVVMVVIFWHGDGGDDDGDECDNGYDDGEGDEYHGDYTDDDGDADGNGDNDD